MQLDTVALQFDSTPQYSSLHGHGTARYCAALHNNAACPGHTEWRRWKRTPRRWGGDAAVPACKTPPLTECRHVTTACRYFRSAQSGVISAQHSLALFPLSTGCRYFRSAQSGVICTQHRLPLFALSKGCRYFHSAQTAVISAQHRLPLFALSTDCRYFHSAQAVVIYAQHRLSLFPLSTGCRYFHSA